jgi:hypothetical protein
VASRKKPAAEPGGMKRGKLFAVENGWVWVTPEEQPDARVIEWMNKYWSEVSPTRQLVVFWSTDLLVGEGGRLLVKDFAFAFPEKTDA